MSEVITIGLDLAKNVFQLHGVDASGEIVIRRQLRRARVLPFFAKLPPCLVGMEASATAHHWAREIGKLGHEVRLMPPCYVKPYVKRNKNDAADAEAICEAVIRQAWRKDPATIPWLVQMIATKPAKVAAVAQANKTARIAWALLKYGGTYQRPEAVLAA